MKHAFAIHNAKGRLLYHRQKQYYICF